MSCLLSCVQQNDNFNHGTEIKYPDQPLLRRLISCGATDVRAD
jgi:hypothetical protein